MSQLTPGELEAAQNRLSMLNIDRAAKRQLSSMLEAANNPNSQRPEVIVQTLPEQQQETILKHAKRVATHQRGILRKGKAALNALSDAEWQAMVDEANEAE